MRTASTRDLRNTYNDLLRWVEAGEEVVIQRRGKAIARLIPEPNSQSGPCTWQKSAAMRRDKTSWPLLTAEQSTSIVHEASGQW